MSTFSGSRSVLALALLLPVIALALLPPTPSLAQDPVGEPAGDFTARWTPEQAQMIALTAEQTTPVIPEVVREAEPMLPGYYVWDSWPMRNRDGSIAMVDGWQVLVALTAPTTVLPGTRHDIATYRYFISRDGQDWQDGGNVFPEGQAFGSRQWAGSTMYDRDTGLVWVFYTATGRAGESEITYEQRMAVAYAQLTVNAEGVSFVNWSPHQIILEPDGVWYEQPGESDLRPEVTRGEFPLSSYESGGLTYTFRDPWYFRDPNTGVDHLLFEANLANADSLFNGVVGLAFSPDGDLTNWQMTPPILIADGVNQELERPHFVFREGKYYLFIDTHTFTFAPGLTGPEGMYGFVSDSLRGEYQPLNGSGLVLANPPEQPYQAYSWLMLPDLRVYSFINYFDLGDLPLDQVGEQSEEFQRSRFGGTFAPPLQVELTSDTTTRVVGVAGAPPAAPDANQLFLPLVRR